MRLMIGAAAMLALTTAQAEGATIALSALTPGTYSQQDSPCFLGASCGANEGLPYTTISGADEAIQFSPTYTLSALTAEVGFTPLIAIDFNQEGADTMYQINYIRVYIDTIDAMPEFAFEGPSNLPQIVTGNGKSDYVISGLDFSSFLGTQTVTFEVSFGNPLDDGKTKGSGDNNNGFETYFLVSGDSEPLPDPVPEPGSLILLGSGLALVASRFRKRAA